MSTKHNFHRIKILIFMAANTTHDAMYHFSEELGMAWVSVNFSMEGYYDAPDPTIGGFETMLAIALIVGALYYLDKKTDLELKNGEITEDDVKTIYRWHIALYLGLIILFIIFTPILMPIIHA